MKVGLVFFSNFGKMRRLLPPFSGKNYVMRKLLILFGLVASLSVLGCSIHRIDIQQGNVLDREMVEDIRLGMSQEQVQFVLGTPLLLDPFHNNRWNYVYTLKKRKNSLEQQSLTLVFENEKLARIIKESYPTAGKK